MRISDWSSDVCASVLTARAGLIGSTAAEALLHASQETRTYGESAANISMTTFLGGLVGAGAGALAHPLRRRVEADLTVPVDPRADPDRQSLGQGKRVSVSVETGDDRVLKTKKKKYNK